MAQAVSVWLFAPGLPNAGVATHCVVNEHSMHIASHQLQVPLSELKASVGGFDHNQLQLHWQQAENAYMVIARDPAAQKQLSALLPAALVAGLKGWHVSTWGQKTVWNSLIYGMGLTVLLVLLGIWQYDRVLGWAANRISIQTEQQMGQAVLASYHKQQDTIAAGAAVDFVKSVGARLTQGSRYQYQWLVVKDEMVNAFAMPGGIVIVNSGLLKKAGSADEVAAVLAHEIQHVEQRHALKNMMHSAGVAAVVMLVLGDANAAMILVAHQVSTQFFSRKVEAEADIKGAQLLVNHRISPKGMSSFFKRLAKEHPNNNQVPTWLSSHPDTEQRIQTVEQFAQQQACAHCQPLTWDIEAILASIQQSPEVKP